MRDYQILLSKILYAYILQGKGQILIKDNDFSKGLKLVVMPKDICNVS